MRTKRDWKRRLGHPAQPTPRYESRVGRVFHAMVARYIRRDGRFVVKPTDPRSDGQRGVLAKDVDALPRAFHEPCRVRHRTTMANCYWARCQQQNFVEWAKVWASATCTALDDAAPKASWSPDCAKQRSNSDFCKRPVQQRPPQRPCIDLIHYL